MKGDLEAFLINYWQRGTFMSTEEVEWGKDFRRT